MDWFVLTCIIVALFVYTLFRTNKVGKKTIQFQDDWRPENITDEYAQVMNKRVEKARKLRENV